MKHFLIFVFAMFAIGTAYGDDITCPAGSYINDDGECMLCPAGTYNDSENATACKYCHSNYPNSEPGASDANQCYSDYRVRACPTPFGCNYAACQYRVYVKRVAKGPTYIFTDGEFKDGCEECELLSAFPGYYIDGDKCEQCPAGTYSTGGENTECVPCPQNKSASMPGATSADECGRILNYRAPNATTPTQIFLGTIKNTSPALAVGIGDDIFYADMKQVKKQVSGNMYVTYNNETYRISDNITYAGDDITDAFYIITTPDVIDFTFTIGASGNFTVDWGDGNIETLDLTSCVQKELSHTYYAQDRHMIVLSGRATEYCKKKKGPTYVYLGGITFSDTTKIAGIRGSLGTVFPTLDDGTNPIFSGLFSGASNLTGTIPPALFNGIYGSPASTLSGGDMFNSVFQGCSGLVGRIPAGLFGDLSGDVGTNTFVNAFNGCVNLTGPAAHQSDGTPLYDIEYDGQTWYEQNPDAFMDMYTDSGIYD